MTKKIRITNACTSDFNVKVEVYDKHMGEDILVETKHINNPADMVEIMLWSGKKIVITENGYSDYRYCKKES